jgi:protein-disulfide isomerase
VRSLLLHLLLAATARAAAAPIPSGHTSEVQVAPRPPLPVRGPRFAPVTIDVPLALPVTQWTADLAPLLHRQLAAGDVRIVYHIAASSASPWAMNELEALLEAARQERFLELCDALIARGPALLSPEELVRLGREAGLIDVELAAALADHRHRAEADRLTTESHANRRPGEVTINGTRLHPYRLSERDLATRMADERKRARAALESGVPLTQLYEKLLREREETSGNWPGDPSRRITLDLHGAPTRGPAIAPVTVVLVSSFGCTQCVELSRTMRRLDARFPGQIRWAWKSYPTTPWATLAAEYAAAAQAQRGFWAFHDQIQRPVWRIEKRELNEAARAAGLDAMRMEREVTAGVYRAAVQSDLADARRAALPWPGYALVNGRALPPGQDPAFYERAVQDELKLGLLDRLLAK